MLIMLYMPYVSGCSVTQHRNIAKLQVFTQLAVASKLTDATHGQKPMVLTPKPGVYLRVNLWGQFECQDTTLCQTSSQQINRTICLRSSQWTHTPSACYRCNPSVTNSTRQHAKRCYKHVLCTAHALCKDCSNPKNTRSNQMWQAS